MFFLLSAGIYVKILLNFGQEFQKETIRVENLPIGGNAYMPNCKTTIPYHGTPEQEERLRKVIAEH